MAKERSALHGLRQRDDVIIKPADKGSAVVMQSTLDYLKEVDCHLNHATYCEQLTADLMSQHTSDVK